MLRAEDIMGRLAKGAERGLQDRAKGWTLDETQMMQIAETGADPMELHRSAMRVAELLLDSADDERTRLGAAFILGWKAGRS